MRWGPALRSVLGADAPREAVGTQAVVAARVEQAWLPLGGEVEHGRVAGERPEGVPGERRVDEAGAPAVVDQARLAVLDGGQIRQIHVLVLGLDARAAVVAGDDVLSHEVE